MCGLRRRPHLAIDPRCVLVARFGRSLRLNPLIRLSTRLRLRTRLRLSMRLRLSARRNALLRLNALVHPIVLCGPAMGGRSLRRDHARTLELSGLRSRCYRWTSVVDRGKLTAVRAGGSLMLPLRCNRRHAPLARIGLLPVRGARVDAASSTVVSDTIDRIDNQLLIHVVDDRDVYVVDSRVIAELSAAPVTAFVAAAEVAETVVESTVEADVWTPISGIPDIEAVRPTPITWRPEEADFGRCHP